MLISPLHNRAYRNILIKLEIQHRMRYFYKGLDYNPVTNAANRQATLYITNVSSFQRSLRWSKACLRCSFSDP